mmetsp:Transcript_1432/g.2866  ORF Transcript_1432/g.2866 Transcript_1432/m.2866 type:complete len:357 (-) Transcript_1432:768-1838(-)|eukprot:CAMPEP_0118935490 /NCGR_PEP_ID=MMETSP1169-20130426/15669_1 /TAXON_ID=36882 /ORGANISM="Pyramimonas obovata, Strain CCMP722" /LENGTH=356 /DNA_ID=CAMNT_0006878535 /DNA_START=86 /DNA_END=1156 /DNA_ORIENTATION=-
MACHTIASKAVCPTSMARDCAGASAPARASFMRGSSVIRPNRVTLKVGGRNSLKTCALLDGNSATPPSGGQNNGGGGVGGPRFDDEAFQIVGIPGVEITPELRSQDGTVLAEGLDVLKGTLLDDGQVAQLETEDEELSLELAWDPEKLIPDVVPEEGIIERRMAERELEQKKAKEEEERAERERLRAELEEFRNSRTIPSEPRLLLQYLLDTEINELEFEMTRVRPSLTPEFFAHVKEQVVDSTPESERREQLEGMLQATQDFVTFMDANVKALAAPADRLKKMLTSKNPRETIAEMAGNGEIDQQLMALLFANIDMAAKSGNDRAAMFMEKIHAYAMKFYEMPTEQPKVVLNKEA